MQEKGKTTQRSNQRNTAEPAAASVAATGLQRQYQK